MHAGADFGAMPEVQSATGGVCPEQRAAAVRALLQERPSCPHHFPEGRNVVWHSTAKENSHLLRQETSARWQPQCHQFGAFTALAAEHLEADGMLLDMHAFLTQCLHSANNGNKSPHVQSSEQGSTLFRERKPAIWEGCAICYHWNHTYLLPSWLHCCLEKNLCVEECNLCTLCVCVCWSFICNVVGVGNRIWGAGWVGLQDVSRRS